MALPSLSKTWQYDLNNSVSVGNFSIGYGDLMYLWKTILTTWGSSPWTVVASCNGAGLFGAADYWADAGDCVYDNAGNAHSWIVLQQTGISSNFQLCVDLNRTGGGHRSVSKCYVSEGGLFTGGTNTNKPTATDEVIVGAASSAAWTNTLDLSVNPAWLNVWQSTDGQSTRWTVFINGSMCCFICIEKPKDTPAGWTIPWLFIECTDNYGAASYRPTYAYLNDATQSVSSRANGSSKTAIYVTSEGCITSMLGEQQTFGADLDGSAWPMFPMGLYCTVAGARGRIGGLNDLWWGSTSIPYGSHYPGDASRLFVQVAHVILPWNGGAAIVMS